MRVTWSLLLIFFGVAAAAQPVPQQQDVLGAMRLANSYFMNKWPDPGAVFNWGAAHQWMPERIKNIKEDIGSMVHSDTSDGRVLAVGEFIRYHIRKGKHDITLYDWERYMDFADGRL